MTESVTQLPTTPERVPPTAAPVEIEFHRPALAEMLRDVWRHRHVARGLLAQVITLHVPKTILGVWWIPIMIVSDTVVKAVVFGAVLSVPSAEGIPYFLFFGLGAMAWWLFFRGTLYSMRSFHVFRHFVVSFHFPLVLVPLAGVGMVFVQIAFYAAFLAIAFGVFLAIDGELYVHFSPALLLAPVALAWMALFAYILGLFTAPVFWRARDVRQAFRLILPFWMYLTPVLYPITVVGGAAGVLLWLNPLAPPLELLRFAVFGSGSIPLYAIASSVGVTLVLLLAGLWFVNRYSIRLIGVTDEDDLEDDL